MSEDVDLKRTAIPGLENALDDFMASYNIEGCRPDYGTEIFRMMRADPEFHRHDAYPIPPSIIFTGSRLDDKTSRRARTSWQRNRKPWSIKSIDHLRTDSPLCVDLISPTSYNGQTHSTEFVPYSLAALPNLAYLYTSLLVGGSASVKTTGRHVVSLHMDELVEQISVEKRLKGLEERIGPALCKRIVDGKEEISLNKKGEININAPYSRLLLMMGLPIGKINGKQYNELGLKFLNNLLDWVENDQLGDADRAHAIDTIKYANDAFVEHRLRLDFNTYKRASLQVPTAKTKETAEGLSNFFSRVWNITNPDILLNIRCTDYGDHFQPSLGVPTEYFDKFCDRYAILLSK